MTSLPPDRFDVIVVGAGPAGVTAAIALGKAGFSVLMCEAGVFPGAENWSGAVYFAENLEHHEAFGSAIIADSPYERKLVERGAYLYNGHSLVGASLRSPEVFRSCYTVLRPVYDRYLAEVAREHGVVLACETTVQSLIRHRGRVVGVHTERGPAYADVVFLAEGDASHLVTQEGYERVSAEEQAEGAPHFLQGVKEVITLSPEIIEERFGLAPGEGLAAEMLLRNATRNGRTVRLNMGGFLYTNRDSVSLGFVLPLDNLKHHFEGSHNLLMEWFKDLPEIQRIIEGGELTSYGAKIIRGGGLREIPQLIDDGLAIGGAASGIGLDFPYPNFTGPATAMGLHFARAVKAIAADQEDSRRAAPGRSPYTAEALRKTYLDHVERSHYYRNVEYLRDWPAYIERTQFFFDRQLDIVNNAAFVVSRRDRGPLRRWWDLTRVLRRALPLNKLGQTVADGRELASTVGLGRLTLAALTPVNLLRFVWNTIGALLPFGGGARIGARQPQPALADSGVAEATAHDGARLYGVFRVDGGRGEPGRPPLLFRWLWRRYGSALASAFSEVYTNDETPIGDKLGAAARHIGGRASVWDLLLKLGLGGALAVTWALQAGVEWFQQGVLSWDLSRFREVFANKLFADNRERIRLDDSRVSMSVPYEIKLGTITYHEGHTSHIKVMWPDDLGARHDLSGSALWNICPAKVYEVRRNRAGHPGVVVNFDNCIKCETCWRATDDVHWSRATQQRLIYQVYSPTQTELKRYLDERPEPRPRLAQGQAFAAGLLEAVDSVEADAATAPAVARLGALLDRTRGALAAFGDDLHRAPLALEAGRRAHLGALADAATESFGAATAIWQADDLAVVRAATGDEVAALWDDAERLFGQLQEHVARRRYFWAELVGKQLDDHHFELIAEACHRAAPGGEIMLDDLGNGAAGLWREALSWRAREAAQSAFAEHRRELREAAHDLFDSHALRELEHGAALTDAQRDWLWHQVGAAAPAGSDYTGRDVLLEELAALDPALAYLAASHLQARDLLQAADRPAPDGWLALVHGGRRELVDGRLTVTADFVPAAVARRFVVVAGNVAVVVDGDDPTVTLDDVGTVGLIGAWPRRLRVEGAMATDTIPLEGLLDWVALDEPAAGEPWAPLLGRTGNDLVAIVRGAGEYLLDRARDHAAGRVQFPGSFEDEAGRDTIAKFGAVKRMLAEMEAHRYTLETGVMAPLADDAWLANAGLKVLSSQAFGPGPHSITYLTGQLFGGTAFSEDDVIAKFYRDSAPFRFLLGHDDALRVEIGRRRLAAEELVPVSAVEREWLDRAADLGPLAEPVQRFSKALVTLEYWANEARGVSDDLLLHAAGHMVVRALAVKALLVRAARRLEGGIPTVAIVEAARLLADRLWADAPAMVDDAELARAAVRAGDDLIAAGDYFPPPAVADAEPYAAVYEADRPHGSGEWLTHGFDADHLRYVPEMLSNDASLHDYWRELEAEFRQRYADRAFDDLPYGRYLEKLHMIPDEDLDYMVDRGFMRMPIAAELGGEAALKAHYYILCMLIGRYGDAALSLAIMANTSIGTTPTLIGLYQDLPRARAELEKVREHPEVLGEIRDGIDNVLALMQRPDLEAITAAYMDVGKLVRQRVGKSMVLKYIGGGFLRAFMAAGQAGKQRDLDGFRSGLEKARELMDGILAGVDERLEEYPRRERAHEFFLEMISAGYISAFALTEPTAGSDSGGVKTTARAARRRVYRDEDGVLWFWLDEDNEKERRYVLDAERVEFDFDNHRLLYRYADGAAPAVIDHSEYDYDKDSAERMRSYEHGDRRVYFTDIAQLRRGEDGELYYEFWVLNGAKMWITNGRFAHCMALYARTEPEGVTGFMVDRHAEGMVVGADEEKLGQRGSPTNELSLTNVRVPRENIIGFRGRGQVNALETLNTGRAGLCVTTHSAIQEMVEDARPYLQGETVPLFRYDSRGPARPLERYWMGRLAEELVATAGTTYELIGLLDNKKTASVRMESAIGKYYGSEAQHECVDWMERLRGLEGQTWLHRVEKTRRDARVLNIYEGTNEVQRFLVLKDLVQRVLPALQKEPLPAPSGELAYDGLAAGLYAAQKNLQSSLEEAVGRFGQLVWANVGAQPCFFRLAEIAGLTKVIDAVLYRLEWCARHEMPEEHRARLEAAGQLYVRRALSRIGVLERRYQIAYEYLTRGRYSPETQLGFLSLEETGAPSEGWGHLPDRLLAQPPAAPLPAPLRIAVLVRPVPMDAPRPRLTAAGFAEPLAVINPDDQAALGLALELARRDPVRIEVTAYGVGGSDVPDALREALALGADAAVHIDTTAAPGVRVDARLTAETLVRVGRDAPADLVLCGAVAADTGQEAVASFVASLQDRDLVAGVDRLGWADEATTLRAWSQAWGDEHLDFVAPAVASVVAGEARERVHDVAALLRAAALEIPRIDATELVGGVTPLEVAHRPRPAGAGGAGRARIDTTAAAVDLIMAMAGEAGGSGGATVAPYDGRLLGLGEQPQDASPSCVFMLSPVTADRPLGGARAELEAAGRMARALSLPLDVLVPVDGADEVAAAAAGAVLDAVPARRVLLVTAEGMTRFGTRGHLEWLEELWAMYRGQPRWLLGTAWANDLLARFAARVTTSADAGPCWSWHNVEAVNNGDGLHAVTGVYGGAVRAGARLPAGDGLRVLTLRSGVDVSLNAGPAAANGGSPEVYHWSPQLAYSVQDDALAQLLASLEGAEDGLESAEYLIDFGYGAGGRDGLDELAEPLRRLLAEELGLERVMVGATRKVTQDLELLPMDRQIGQTGASVNPKLIIALAVSGAPQHVDYIGERATILSFNIDPDAPLNKLNEQRPKPVVHPIVGDVWDTVPQFLRELRERVSGDSDA